MGPRHTGETSCETPVEAPVLPEDPAVTACGPLAVRFGPATLHVRSADEAEHWALDREGRLLAGHAAGWHHRIGLDGAVLTRGPGAGQVPWRAPGPEARVVLARAARTLRAAADGLARGEVLLEHDAGAARGSDLPRVDPGASDRARAAALLLRAAGRADRPEAERAAYRAAYRVGAGREATGDGPEAGGAGMLPPDCAQALVVQVTEGCHWDRCSFCTLYAGVPFRVKGRVALEEHLERVAALLGRGAALRRGLFLGDANALLAPMPTLLAALEASAARFPEAARAGAHTFVDAFGGRGRTEDELRALRAAGLRRVTVGLESGSPDVLRRLRKPSTPEGVRALVGRAKAAGLGVNVTVLAGLGGGPDPATGDAGDPLAREHLAATTRVVRGLGLGAGDVVYVAPLVGPGPTRAPREADAPGAAHPAPVSEPADAPGARLAPLAPDEVARQAQALARALAAGPWRVVPYDVRRHVY